MKKMLLLIATCSTLMASCNKDEDGILTRQDFYGTYTAEDNCSTTYAGVKVRESDVNPETQVLIDNLGGYFLDTYATIDGTHLSFEDSQFVDCDLNGVISNHEISGTGTFSKDKLTITYTYSRCGDTGTCTINCTKQ